MALRAARETTVHLEGQQSVLAALTARSRKIDLILVKAGAHHERYQAIFEEAERQAIPVKNVAVEELDSLAHGRTHGGLLALCGRRSLQAFDDLKEILQATTGSPLLLLLEGVEDVQHLGYILRSAEGLGAHAVLLKKHLWNFDETTLSRTSSGAFERVPLVKFSDAHEIERLSKFDIQLWGCIAGVNRTIYEVDLTVPVALAVGGEKRGLSGKIREACHGFMRIPMAPGSASSLSLTHAACLVLGEAARQRWR